jgi:predicted nucleic acid-binding protein
MGWRSGGDADRATEVIVVDTSVWIAHLRDHSLAAVQRLRDPAIADHILVGDIVLTEVLQGARDDAHAARLEAALRQFPVVAMVGDHMAAKAAFNYRRLRAAGFTMNKIADLFIGTYCIEHGHILLHCDAGFEPMTKLCGLLIPR